MLINIKTIIVYFCIFFVLILILPISIVKYGSNFSSFKKIKSQNNSLDNSVQNIKVFFHKENCVKKVPLEDYIKCVVAAEMPVEFETEALKAQAIAARTYVYGRFHDMYGNRKNHLDNSDICTSPEHCQAYISKSDAEKQWSTKTSMSNWGKIENSVNSTKGLIILYSKTAINPLFHSNSGGFTENADDVWDLAPIPYLKGIISNGEDNSPDYTFSTTLNKVTLNTVLKEKYPDIKLKEKDLIKDFKILKSSQTGRIKKIIVGNIELSGTEFRKLFELKSTNFKITKINNDEIKITTLGSGHGVGMSQCGANALAKKGAKYEKILKYYYKDIEIGPIS